MPTIERFYNGEGYGDDRFWDPNLKTVIEGPIPDFEMGQVVNSKGGTDENDGIARIIAWTEGRDMSGDSVKVWNWKHEVFSTWISVFRLECSADTLRVGERASIFITLYDINGNPVVSGSKLKASISPKTAQAELTWTEKETLDPGTCFYSLTVTNAIDPLNPKSQSMWATITLSIESQNGYGESSVSVYMLAP
jgi:hypothetical protein